jgi:hypothetical protein
MSVPQILSIISFAIGIAGFAGGVLGYFGKGRGDAIIAYQSNEIQLRDGTIARLKEELAAVTAERDALKVQKTELIELGQGSPQLAKVASEVKKLREELSKLGKRGS